MSQFIENSDNDYSNTTSEPGIENQHAQQPDENSSAVNANDKDILNSDSQNPVTNSAEEISAGIDEADIAAEKIIEPSEEDMDEEKNNLRDALNDDSYPPAGNGKH